MMAVSKDPCAVLDPLNQAAEDYLKAMAYNHLGKEGEREEAAACFKEHVTALEKLQDEEASLVY